MVPQLYIVKKYDDMSIHSFIYNTGIGRADRRTDLPYQYLALHALHADTR